MPQKSLISRLKGLARMPGLRAGPAVEAPRETHASSAGLRILRPAEVGGAGREHGSDRPHVEMPVDVVVRSVLDAGILTTGELERVSTGRGFSLDWRAVCTAWPDRADTLRRFAASIYGFQPVVVSQVGTLVLADRLSRRLPREVWRQCFRLNCLPVLPHGASIRSAGALTLASPDPSRAAVRNLSRSVLAGNSTLAYADLSVIRELMAFLVAEVPPIADAVRADVGEPAVSNATAA